MKNDAGKALVKQHIESIRRCNPGPERQSQVKYENDAGKVLVKQRIEKGISPETLEDIDAD